jgi:hypothetical protein
MARTEGGGKGGGTIKESDSGADSGMLKVGTPVVLHSLILATYLNGAHATIIAPARSSDQQVQIRMDHGDDALCRRRYWLPPTCLHIRL